MNWRITDLTDRAFIWVPKIILILMIGLAVAGGVNSYSPVPFWDMWPGTVDFYIQANGGRISAWWQQHNEHRIVLANILFWIDYKCFGGLSVFLIAANYVLTGFTAIFFVVILRSFSEGKAASNGEIFLSCVMSGWLFLWSQEENLTWGYQSQFILAQLLPLYALYALHLSIASIHSKRYFLIACAVGIASAGTMINGVLTLPLMVLYAFFTRQSAIRIGVLISLSCIVFYLYFYDYHSPVGHGTILGSLKENPFGLIQYVLLYLGAPFYFLSDKTETGKSIALLMGCLFVLCTIQLVVHTLIHRDKKTLGLVLLFFIFYVGGSAFGTAGGRLIFGLDQALSSRYTTPVLMAWAALIILYSPVILNALTSKNWICLSIFSLLGVLMMLVQIQALNPRYDVLFEKNVAALALELQVKDQIQVNNIYPDVLEVLPVAKIASLHNLSVFGLYPYRNARKQLGKVIQFNLSPRCEGNLEKVENIVGDEQFVRVSGWIYNPSTKTVPNAIRILNNQNEVVGFGLTGQTRPDVDYVIDKKIHRTGYKGYLLANQTGVLLTIQGDSTDCQVKLVALAP